MREGGRAGQGMMTRYTREQDELASIRRSSEREGVEKTYVEDSVGLLSLHLILLNLSNLLLKSLERVVLLHIHVKQARLESVSVSHPFPDHLRKQTISRAQLTSYFPLKYSERPLNFFLASSSGLVMPASSSSSMPEVSWDSNLDRSISDRA